MLYFWHVVLLFLTEIKPLPLSASGLSDRFYLPNSLITLLHGMSTQQALYIYNLTLQRKEIGNDMTRTVWTKS